jgi:CheY-like chemotaxis protein
MSNQVKIALLVEDEPLIAMIAADMLDELGYQVLEARTKREAMDVLAVEDGITLLFTDIDLADGSSGTELAIEFARMYPSVTIVVTSGRFQPTLLPAGARFLPKPYSDHDLSEAIFPRAGVSKRQHGLELAIL